MRNFLLILFFLTSASNMLPGVNTANIISGSVQKQQPIILQEANRDYDLSAVNRFDEQNNLSLSSDSLSSADSVKQAADKGTNSENKKPADLKKDEASFFSPNLLYFVGAAVVATIVYIVWPQKEPDTKTKSTFGTPLSPK